MGFFHYMFLPVGQPWYTGAFWSNQTQWMLVMFPSLLAMIWRSERNHRKLREHLRKIEKK